MVSSFVFPILCNHYSLIFTFKPSGYQVEPSIQWRDGQSDMQQIRS